MIMIFFISPEAAVEFNGIPNKRIIRDVAKKIHNKK